MDIGFKTLEDLTDAAVPKHIRLDKNVVLEPAKSERYALRHDDIIINHDLSLMSLPSLCP